MRKILYVVMIALMSVITFSNSSCTRIDAGHVGVKFNLYGSDKGIDNIAEVSGMVWFNPITQRVFETPTFVQIATWTADSREGSKDNEELVLTTSDGLEVRLDVSLVYRVNSENAVPIFVKYREPLDVVSKTVLRSFTRDGFNDAAANFTAEEVYSERAKFENMADSMVRSILEPEGFTVERIILLNNIRLPQSVSTNIEAKVNAKQIALQKEQELAQAVADANKKIETARGQAESMKIQADAERYAYEQKQRALTPLLIQQQFLEKWDGSYGTGNVFGQGPLLFKNIQ